jgi:hypothetical protein
LILDLVIMPGLYGAGMMTSAGFAAAGYSIFWIFNRVELLCAAVALTGSLVLWSTTHLSSRLRNGSIILSTLLLTIALIYTYILTPQMSALGLQLNLFEPGVGMPEGMLPMQAGYWGLETLKLVAGGILLSWCYQSQTRSLN